MKTLRAMRKRTKRPREQHQESPRRSHLPHLLRDPLPLSIGTVKTISFQAMKGMEEQLGPVTQERKAGENRRRLPLRKAQKETGLAHSCTKQSALPDPLESPAIEQLPTQN